MADGDERSAVAYHGVPLHFKFVCGAKSHPQFLQSTRIRTVLKKHVEVRLTLTEVCTGTRSQLAATGDVQARCLLFGLLFPSLAVSCASPVLGLEMHPPRDT